ncbi:MAG: type II secretion system F family protein, partial [bacterium]
MTIYRYQAARSDGRLVTGVIDAARVSDVGAVLMARGLHPVSVKCAERQPQVVRAAPRRELAIVFRSLASLVAAGVPVDKALLATEHVARGTLKVVLTNARQALREGQTLGHALGAAHGLVPAIAVGMIKAGERGGRMHRALEEVANHLEQEAELLGRVRQALAYPILLSVVGSATVLLITTVVVPRFAELLSDVGQELPLATRTLLGVSGFLQAHGLILVAVALVAGWAFSQSLKKPAVRLAWHKALLKLPVIGRVRHGLATTRTCRSLAGMLEAGMPLLPALEATREATGDEAVVERLGNVRDQVAGGSPLTIALEREDALTPSALQLIAVGEGSGQ